MGDRRASASTLWVRITNINLNKWPAKACSGQLALEPDQLLKLWVVLTAADPGCRLSG